MKSKTKILWSWLRKYLLDSFTDKQSSPPWLWCYGVETISKSLSDVEPVFDAKLFLDNITLGKNILVLEKKNALDTFQHVTSEFRHKV